MCQNSHVFLSETLGKRHIDSKCCSAVLECIANVLPSKDLLEGDSAVTVSMPKGFGKDIAWEGDSPVIGSVRNRIKKYFDDTAREDPDETLQADNRITYFELFHVFVRGTTKKDTKLCKACAAKVYLEGKRAAVAPTVAPAAAPSSSSSSGGPAPHPKRTAADLMVEIGKLHEQKAAGVWTDEEFQRMKRRILEDAGV